MSKRDRDEIFNVEIADKRRLVLGRNLAKTDILDPFSDNPDSPYQTDFDELMRQHAEAQFGPDGQVVDGLDQAYQLQETQKAAANANSPNANVNPASWDRGVLGAVTALQTTSWDQLCFWPGDERECVPVTVTVSPLLGGSGAGVSLNAPKYNGSDPASSVPAMFTVGPLPVIGRVRPVGLVTWGTRDGNFSALFDIGNGVQFTLNCSSVYVYAMMDPSSQGPTASTLASISVVGSLGFWATVRAIPLTYTQFLNGANPSFTQAGDGIDSGANAIVIRPPFATSVEGFVRTDPNQLWHIYFLDGTAQTFSVTALTTNLIGTVPIPADTAFTGPVPIPDDCVYVMVKNVSGGAGAHGFCRLVFGLF